MSDNRQRGLVRIASMDIDTQTGGLSTGTRAVAAGTGVGEVFDRGASEFSKIGNMVGAWADHAASVEGREAGSIAGLDPEFRPSRSLTIRGEAFDKAGLDVWGSRHKQAMLDDIEGLHTKYASDPRALDGAIEKKRGAWLGAVPDPVRAEMTLAFERAKTTSVRQATRQRLAEFQAEQRAAAVDDMTASMKRLHQQAYSLGLDAEADQHIAEASKEIDRLMARRDVTGKALFTPAQARKVMADLKEDVAQARILGTLERTPTAEGKQAILDKFREEFGKSEGAGGLFGLDKFRAVERTIEAEVRQAATRANVIAEGVRTDVSRFAKMAEKGETLLPDELVQLRSRVIADAPQLAGVMSGAEDLMQFVQAARRLPQDELAARVLVERQTLTREGGSLRSDADKAAGWARVEAGEKLLAEMRTALKDDPMAWHAKTGNAGVAPLDFADPATLPQAMATRIAQARTLARQHGHAPRYLMDGEAARLAAIAGKGGDDLLMVSSMVAQAGDAAPEIMAELGKHGPATAFVGGMVVAAGGQTPRAAEDAAAGIGLMKTDGFKSRLPKQAVIETAAIEEIGLALKAQPRAATAVMQVANAIYEARALRTGKNEDADLWKQSLREALGEREIGGEKYGGVGRGSFWNGRHDPVIVPPWLKQSGLRAAIDGLTEADITAGLGGMPKSEKGDPLPISAIRRGRLVGIGSGRYLVSTSSDPDDPQYLAGNGPAGTFVLDLNRLRPAIQKRRPDLVAGGR